MRCDDLVIFFSSINLLRLVLLVAFIIYTLVIVAGASVLIFFVSPRYGQTNPLVYITITGTIGSLSVMGCKGLGVAIKQTIAGDSQLTNLLTWLIVAFVIVFITVQMIYLNRALDVFNTSVVTPILYVVFTSFVILASAILFKEWGNLGTEDVVGNLCGFLTIVSGIFLLQAFKDMNVSLGNLPKARKDADCRSDCHGNIVHKGESEALNLMLNNLESGISEKYMANGNANLNRDIQYVYHNRTSSYS